MRRAPVALLLAVAACGPGPIVRHGRLNTALLDSVERGLADVRELRFTAPVPGRVLDEAGVRELLARELAREFPPGDLERVSAVYARLGLLPAGTDLRPLLQKLYAEQLAALYDPRTKTLAVTAAAIEMQTFGLRLIGFFTGRDLLGEVLIAHELTHALQDQHWGLPTTTPPITDADGNRTLARRALLEGDASLASVAYARRGPLDRDTVFAFVEQVSGIPEELAVRHPDIPEVVRASLAFQYNQGSVFAAAAYLRGGWNAVDEAESDPPVSTEQVLHPEKYFGTPRDVPTPVCLGGTEELERRGWTRIVEDTLGENDVRVLVGRTAPARGHTVAAGWDGDRLRALQRDGEVAIVWLTVWDSEADAAEFAEVLPLIAPGASVERRAAWVLVLIGIEDPALPARIWRRSRCAATAS